MDGTARGSGGSGGGIDGFDPPTSSGFIAATADASQDIIMDGKVDAEHKPKYEFNNTTGSGSGEGAMVCARCNMPGSDLRFLPCNCTVHSAASMCNQSPTVSPSGERNFCCFCQARSLHADSYNDIQIESIQILSLSFDDLERAGELRYEEQEEQQSEKGRCNGKRKASGSGTVFQSPSPSSEHGVEKDQKALAAALPFLGIAHYGSGRGGSVKNEHLRTMSSLSSSFTPSYRAANSDHRRRTGRWTAAETAYVDYIVECFEAGILPLPQGVKLNEFLSDALMCKPSRLTKKMKSAKLSMRSFAFGNWAVDNGSDVAKWTALSKLEGEFLDSINPQYLRLEAQFNLQRMWRTHFWNLCLQIGFASLDIATEWLPSLETMELRAGQAEEEVRRAERRKMGMALKQDAKSCCGLSGVFIGGMPGADGAIAQSRGLIMDSPLTEADPSLAVSSTIDNTKSTWSHFGALGRPRSVSRSRSGSIAAPSFPNAPPSNLNAGGRQSTAEPSSNHNLSASTTTQAELDFLNEIFSAEGTGFADPFDGNARLDATKSSVITEANVLSAKDGSSNGMPSMVSMESIQQSQADDSSSNSSFVSQSISTSSGGVYLDTVVKFLSDMKAPFQTAECWVPSFLPSDAYDGTDACEAASGDGEVARATAHPQDIQHLRLCYAGRAILSDAVSSSTLKNMAAYGEYSSHFSFSPGKGVPGRVYSTNIPSWENDIQVAAPEYFKRVGGAKLYGIRTLAAFPVASPSVGRIVVVLYSTLNVQRDVSMARKIFLELQRHRPEPHWRLVVDVGQVTSDSSSAAELASSSMSIEEMGVKGGRETSPSPMTVDGQEATTVSDADDDQERDVISLLGDNIPTVCRPGDLIAQGMMSLRILLLRPRNKRSDSENEKLDIVKRSYRGYKRCSVSRPRREIAHLLARDWSFLAPLQEDKYTKPAAQVKGEKEAAESVGVSSGPDVGKPAYQFQSPLLTPRSDARSDNSASNGGGSSRTNVNKSEPARGNQPKASASGNDLSLIKGPSSGERRCRAISTLSDPFAITPSSAEIRLDSFNHSHHGIEKAPPPPPSL